MPELKHQCPEGQWREEIIYDEELGWLISFNFEEMSEYVNFCPYCGVKLTSRSDAWSWAKRLNFFVFAILFRVRLRAKKTTTAKTTRGEKRES